jgi:RNA polymerase sigma-70 factor (ECF subfamily)
MSRRKLNSWEKDNRNDRSHRNDRSYGESAEVSELFSVNSGELSTTKDLREVFADDTFLLPIEDEHEFDRPELASPARLEQIDPDEATKLAFLGGSEEAFLRLYAKYEVSLFYYCKRMLHSEFAAEDAFQDIWMRVFELRKRKVDDRSSTGVSIVHFRGLLFKSARNLCLNMLRDDHFDESIEAESEDWPEADSRKELRFEEPMTGAASGREIQSLMVKALRKLPFDQRETFVLHEYSGFSYAEIAEMMNVPERNVKVRAHRARIRLRKFIQSWLGLGELDDPSNFI